MARETTAIGRRLRQLREARGMSLSELARQAAVGKATLSGLENGTRDPRLETLYAIAAALNVPMSALTLDQGAPAHEASSVRGTAVVSRLLEVFEEPGAVYELFALTIVPGAEQLSPAHPAGVTEHVTVHSGQLRAGPAKAPLTGGPGDYVSWRSDVPHVYAALGGQEVRATLLIRTPR
ncbi:helix-turn-helix domain-containing protein [Catelliglobosispora koreensis]|uniref:helix-turn-helix domain-containing protein n=1 Tax=Catelliglobosispora koreensis TaxID=129052 RepID=UPI00058D6FA3|nr:XRE family transcriptional regulator [Catelliglobosispora koreensis]